MMTGKKGPTQAVRFRASSSLLLLLATGFLAAQFRSCIHIGLRPVSLFERAERTYPTQFAVAELSSLTIASFWNERGGSAFPWGPRGSGTRAAQADSSLSLRIFGISPPLKEEQGAQPRNQSAVGSPIYFVGAPANSVTVLNSETAAQMALIQVGTDPRWIEMARDHGKAYVSNQGSDSVTVIDTASMAAERTLQLPEGSAPFGVAPGPDGDRLYVVNTGLDSLSAVDLVSGQVAATATAGSGALHVAVSPDGQLAYVTNQTEGSVSVFDTLSMDLVTTIEGLTGATSVTFGSQGRKAYVTTGSGSSAGRLHVIRTSDHSTVGSVPVGADPVSVRLSPYGNFLFVANRGSGSITMIDVESETVTQTVPVGAAPMDVAAVL